MKKNGDRKNYTHHNRCLAPTLQSYYETKNNLKENNLVVFPSLLSNVFPSLLASPQRGISDPELRSELLKEEKKFTYKIFIFFTKNDVVSYKSY